eukprot:1158594-Pelagomonas_calceolata.AAC.3
MIKFVFDDFSSQLTGTTNSGSNPQAPEEHDNGPQQPVTVDSVTLSIPRALHLREIWGKTLIRPPMLRMAIQEPCTTTKSPSRLRPQQNHRQGCDHNKITVKVVTCSVLHDSASETIRRFVVAYGAQWHCCSK